MPHVYGECALNAAAEATNSLLSGGNLDYSRLTDAANPYTLHFDSVSSYESYVRLCQWLLPVIIILSCACCLIFVDVCLFGSSRLRTRISFYRKRSFLRGILLCSGSVAASTLLLSHRFTGLKTKDLLRLSGTPNFYYAAQLTLCLWIFATGFMHVGHSLYAHTESMCRRMESFTLSLLALFCFSNLPQDSAGSQARQVIGILLLSFTSCLLASYQQLVSWACSWEDLHALRVIENFLHNPFHPDYQHTSAKRFQVRGSDRFKENTECFRRAIDAKIQILMTIDVLLVVSLVLLYDDDVVEHFRPALVQIDNPPCAGYWPLILFVVLGFLSVLFNLAKIAYLFVAYTDTDYERVNNNRIILAFFKNIKY